jgi:uncharacterized protein
VTVDRAAQEHGQARNEDLARARRYLHAARDYVEPPLPQLFAVGGLSGSGKTTLAAALAPYIGSAPRAVHLRSDLERKALAGVGELERLPDSADTAEAHRRVYAVLRDKAKIILAVNHSIIVDAVYDAESERNEIEAMAGPLGVPFRAFWLQTDAHKLLARVAARHNDASDATPTNIVAMEAFECRGKCAGDAPASHGGGPPRYAADLNTQLRWGGLSPFGAERPTSRCGLARVLWPLPNATQESPRFLQ